MQIAVLLLLMPGALGESRCAASELTAADWPHLRGPNYDAISQQTGLAGAWPEGGPPVVWTRELGHLGVGARANITVVDKDDKLATYTFVNGVMAAFENRVVRESNGAGGWVSKWGILDRTGVGDLAAFGYVLD